jgi:hypothetical protein
VAQRGVLDQQAAAVAQGVAEEGEEGGSVGHGAGTVAEAWTPARQDGAGDIPPAGGSVARRPIRGRGSESLLARMSDMA